MSLTRTLFITALILLTNLAHSGPILMNGQGVNGNYFHNGLITTEYREDGSVWEWLDLTVTNGISFKSIASDLDDNALLDNSYSLVSNEGALSDVLQLSSNQKSGWSTVSEDESMFLINDFFGLSLLDQQAHSYGMENTNYMNEFISLFGDTISEGYEDQYGVRQQGTNESNHATSNSARGFTNQKYFGIFNELLIFHDGARAYDAGDFRNDFINTSTYDYNNRSLRSTGTFLVREKEENSQTVSVPEPSTLILFALPLLGLILRKVN